MKYRLMDIIACPYDKHFPLKLTIFTINKYEKRDVKLRRKPACEIICQYKGKKVDELEEIPQCEECFKYEIEYGVLYCEKCMRWYPIIDEIPILLPDEYRKKEEDIKFLKRFKDKIPEDILKKGRPWSLE